MGKELIEEQRVIGLPRESRQTTVKPETCGECSLALDLACLSLGL